MQICPNCGLPVPSTRRICPGCEEPLGQSGAANDTAVDGADIGDQSAESTEPTSKAQLQAVRGALARQADRGWYHDSESNERTRRGTRRWMVVAAIVVAVLGSMFVVNPFSSDAQITASTPADQLPWATYSAPDGSFAVNLPGVPQEQPADGWNGLAVTRYELDIPGALITVSVVVPGGTQGASTVSTARAQEVGAKLTWQQETHGPLGVELEASFSDGTTGGWMRVLVSRAATYVVDVRTPGDAPRARAIFDHVIGSFRPAGGG